jgi:excisionase family DNA binding protein
VDLAISEAAARLHVHRSRAEQMLRSGQLRGRQVGRSWFVDEQSVADAAAHRRLPVRPMAPARAWGLLDLLSGGNAQWLSDVARSQVRSRARALGAADGDIWRALLRARSDLFRVRVHPGMLPRLLEGASGFVLPAGPARAVELGADLVALDSIPEVYVRAEDWPRMAHKWRAQQVSSGEKLRVRVPRGVWPFEGQVGPIALAADLLESAEPRAAGAGERLLLDGWRAWSRRQLNR